MKNTSKSESIKPHIIILLSLFVLAMIIMTVILFPYMKELAKPEAQQEFKVWVESLGIGGWAAVLGIQMLQIILAFIPGEPVELLAGILYGGFGGLWLCLLGCMIASSGIFTLTKLFGRPLIEKVFQNKELKEYAFLSNARKLETIVFILFLIPGTPKDMLTYVVGTTSMKLSRFLIISTFARVPSIITSTFIGATVRQGEWIWAIAIFIFTAIIGLAGIRYKDSLIEFCRRQGSRLFGRHRKEIFENDEKR